MKKLIIVLLLCGVGLCQALKAHDADLDDNEFAEFEDFEDEEEPVKREAGVPPKTESVNKETPQDGDKDDEEEEEENGGVAEEEEDDGVVESDDDEFEHLQDEEEFEGFDKERGSTKPKGSEKLPDLEIAKVPLHLRTNWDSFYVEMLMIAGLGVYFLNFLAGKTKNSKLAQAWLNSHKDLLDSNFSVVGDDGSQKEASSGTLMKESENVYALWCSGRTHVEGMLIELKLLKRQDIINILLRMFKPASDQIVITVDMDKTSMDKFVFAIASKKSALKLHKEMNDLSQFAEKKSLDRYEIPSSYQMLSEIGEANQIILDKKMCQALTKYEGLIEYIHFSDQFSGVKSQDETPNKLPETKSVLLFCFNVPTKGKTKPSDMEFIKPLMHLVFYSIDKVSRLTLGKEARGKADKNRQKAEEVFLKSIHSQRQEAAQSRREEKRRVEKDRLMNEEDPEKARKLEDKEAKRELKKKIPKVKMMKVG